MDVTAEEHFDGPSNKDPDRASRSVSGGVDQVLGHGDGFGRAGEAHFCLLHQRHWTTKLLSLLHALDINCGVTLFVSLRYGSIADGDHCVLYTGSAIRGDEFDKGIDHRVVADAGAAACQHPLGFHSCYRTIVGQTDIKVGAVERYAGTIHGLP